MQLDGNNLQKPWDALYKEDPMLLMYVHSPVQKVLNLRGCGLDELPACMVLMQSLEELDISQNQLRTLPRLLSELPHLRAIRVDDNPLEPHLAAILAKVFCTVCCCNALQPVLCMVVSTCAGQHALNREHVHSWSLYRSSGDTDSGQ